MKAEEVTRIRAKARVRMLKQSRERIAERILKQRERKLMSQRELAEKAGVDRKTINRIENGHFSPSIDTLLRIADVLEVTPSRLLISCEVGK